MTRNSRPSPPRRRTGTLLALSLVGVLLFAGFVALGTWQVQRRAWKLDLIERVNERVHAPALPAPGPDAWPAVTPAGDEYRHVSLAGRFLNDRETLVQATTELGAGFWVLTPLQSPDGSSVLVNRGFVPPERRDPATRRTTEAGGPVQVTGLLRMSEPGGGFLRRNDPAADRWHSRDVQAIAAARGLRQAAPYFVDLDAAPGARGSNTAQPAWPVGGLTVIRFPNSHLVYALTWYGLALMVVGAAWLVVRSERRSRRGTDGAGHGA